MARIGLLAMSHEHAKPALLFHALGETAAPIDAVSVHHVHQVCPLPARFRRKIIGVGQRAFPKAMATSGPPPPPTHNNKKQKPTKKKKKKKEKTKKTPPGGNPPEDSTVAKRARESSMQGQPWDARVRRDQVGASRRPPSAAAKAQAERARRKRRGALGPERLFHDRNLRERDRGKRAWRRRLPARS